MLHASASMHHKPWLKHYDAHIPESLSYPDNNLVEIFEAAVKAFPQNPFIFYNKDIYTYREVERLINALSLRLLGLGLRVGERVAVLLPNIPEFVISYYAILKAGGIVAAMNPNYKRQELEFLLIDSTPHLVICLKNHLEILLSLGLNTSDIIVVNRARRSAIGGREEMGEENTVGDFWELCLEEGEVAKFPKVSSSAAAIFQYSGGTTGIPKAAIGSHKNIIANITQFKVWCNLEEGSEIILAVIPLYHVYGMVLTMNLAIAACSAMVLIDDPTDIEKILSEIENHRVSFYAGVPTMFYAINQHPKVKSGEFDIRSIKACISGSAPLHSQIKADFERLTGGKLVEGYGLSEAPTATHCNPIFGINKSGSIGLPLPDVECKVVDLERGEVEMGLGEVGELIIKGPQVMIGYHNKPEDERTALRDGWLYTGDVARMDADGYFFIVDRKKSLIKVSGFQVWPNEVERVIAEHPHVSACAVGGVPDLKQGEKVVAWVVRKAGVEICKEDIRAWCQSRLVSYKVPSVVEFRTELPISGVGKILKGKLIEEYLEKEASESETSFY